MTYVTVYDFYSCIAFYHIANAQSPTVLQRFLKQQAESQRCFGPLMVWWLILRCCLMDVKSFIATICSWDSQKIMLASAGWALNGYDTTSSLQCMASFQAHCSVCRNVAVSVQNEVHPLKFKQRKPFKCPSREHHISFNGYCITQNDSVEKPCDGLTLNCLMEMLLSNNRTHLNFVFCYICYAWFEPNASFAEALQIYL